LYNLGVYIIIAIRIIMIIVILSKVAKHRCSKLYVKQSFGNSAHMSR
jgi:hypothetical protein